MAEPAAAAYLSGCTHLASVFRFISSGFCVVEGKHGELACYVSQAVAEIYGCAKSVEKNILRGALTNGREWIFLIVYCNPDGDGAAYKESFVRTFDAIHKDTRGPPEIDIVRPNPDVIAGVLAYWVEHSFEDISADDWPMDSREE